MDYGRSPSWSACKKASSASACPLQMSLPWQPKAGLRDHLQNAGFVVVSGQQAEDCGPEVPKRVSMVHLEEVCPNHP